MRVRLAKYFRTQSRKIITSIFIAVSLTVFSHINAQDFKADFELSAGSVTKGTIPLWLRSDMWGNVPPNGFSLGFKSFLQKGYRSEKTFDWGGGFESRLNIGNDFNLKIIQAYAKLKFGTLELEVGRVKQIMGLCDTVLSSGSFSVSGNAPGIPGIQTGIPEYQSVHFTGDVLALKFNYAHGFLGVTPTNLNGKREDERTWFHQKSIYGRLGKPSWKLKLYGGFNHQVFWGNEKNIFGSSFTLSKAQTYFYVITGRSYATSSIEPSRIGNHLGSFDLGMEFDFGNWLLFIYRQSFYDFIAFRYLANISDGLNGISLTNKNENGKFIRINRLLVEFLYTKNQGKRHSLHDPTYYNENYYNNYIYFNGWSYKDYPLGNPLLTTKNLMRQGLSEEAYDYFHNNLVSAIHLGLQGEIGKWDFTLKSTYSLNYGTYFTKFEKGVSEFSFFAECKRDLSDGKGTGLRTAFDKGGLLYDSMGVFLFFYQAF